MKTWFSRHRPGAAVKSLLMAGLVAGGFAAGCAFAAQPHMMNALSALQTARTELQAAEHNKGGHRDAALVRINEAINQVRLGIQAGGG